MNIFNAMLNFHIACGVFALVLGPVSMYARKLRGLHTNVGELYHWVFLCICISACALAVLEWQRLWWFIPVGIFSYAFALLGYLSARLRWKNWLSYHLAGQGGSYIAMTTAVLVVNLGINVWWAWILPTLIGSPLIGWITSEVTSGRRPKYS